ASDLQEMLDFALDKALQVTGSQYGFICHYYEDRQEFVLSSWSKGVMPICGVTDKQTVFQLDKIGIWGEAVRQRRLLLLNDYAASGHPAYHTSIPNDACFCLCDEASQQSSPAVPFRKHTGNGSPGNI
ncbi:MAG: GAF domain-containing protein, partial [Erysipelotrichia bacterium]|nr:GAF domain-containing protein [Erysipelotrichia bacterium]